MKEITYISEMGGGKHPMIVTLPIATESDIKKGTPIFYNKQAVSTLSGENSTLIGILAEDYYCEENEFIPGSGSGEIKVIVSHNAVYECDALVFNGASSSNNGTIIWEIEEEPSDEAVASLNGTKLILCEKAEGSANNDSLGTVYSASSNRIDGARFYLDCGINITSVDDKFAFLPPYGYSHLSINAGGRIALNVNKNGNIRIIGADEKRGTIKFIITDII